MPYRIARNVGFLFLSSTVLTACLSDPNQPLSQLPTPRPECLLPDALSKKPLRPPQYARKPMPQPAAITAWIDATVGQIKNADQVEAIQEFVKQACQDKPPH